MPHLVKMFGGDVNAAVEPANRPSVKVETVEHGSLAAIIEGQVQPIAIKGAGGCNPF